MNEQEMQAIQQAQAPQMGEPKDPTFAFEQMTNVGQLQAAYNQMSGSDPRRPALAAQLEQLTSGSVPGLAQGSPPAPSVLGGLIPEARPARPPQPPTPDEPLFPDQSADAEADPMLLGAICGVLAKVDCLQVVRNITRGVPALFPTSQWDRELLTWVVEGMASRIGDPEWVSRAYRGVLLGMRNTWSARRAAQVVALLAYMNAITARIAVVGTVDDILEGAEEPTQAIPAGEVQEGCPGIGPVLMQALEGGASGELALEDAAGILEFEGYEPEVVSLMAKAAGKWRWDLKRAKESDASDPVSE